MAEPDVGRRTVLQAALSTPLLGLQRTAANPVLIQDENRRPGAQDWQLTRVRLDKRNEFRAPDIEGYDSHQSIEAGDTLRVMVSARPASRFTLEVFRMGYYGGGGARLMTKIGPLQAKEQQSRKLDPNVCANASGNRRLK